MTSIKDMLKKAASIVKRNIAVISQGERLSYPLDKEGFKVDFYELKENVNTNYNGYNIYSIDSENNRHYVCIQASEYEESDLIKLLLLSFESLIHNTDFNYEHIKKIINGNYNQEDILKLQQDYNNITDSYIILIENPASKDNISDIYEIIKNTMNTVLIFDYADRILAVVKEEDIVNSTNDLAQNIMTELYLECTVAVGGKLDNIEQLPEIYNNCLNALCLKKKYDIPDRILFYDNMYSYRVAFALPDELRSSILEKVFTPRFKDAVNNEMEITIEEFFRCNLNLTDTANRLYIHRNTLLYRIDKIYKYTGFDLKRFEDCWLFKLAWIIGRKDFLT